MNVLFVCLSLLWDSEVGCLGLNIRWLIPPRLCESESERKLPIQTNIQATQTYKKKCTTMHVSQCITLHLWLLWFSTHCLRSTMSKVSRSGNGLSASITYTHSLPPPLILRPSFYYHSQKKSFNSIFQTSCLDVLLLLTFTIHFSLEIDIRHRKWVQKERERNWCKQCDARATLVYDMTFQLVFGLDSIKDNPGRHPYESEWFR